MQPRNLLHYTKVHCYSPLQPCQPGRRGSGCRDAIHFPRGNWFSLNIPLGSSSQLCFSCSAPPPLCGTRWKRCLMDQMEPFEQNWEQVFSIPRGSIWNCWVNKPPQVKFNSPSVPWGAVAAQLVPHCCSPGARPTGWCHHHHYQTSGFCRGARAPPSSGVTPCCPLGSASVNPVAATEIPPPFLSHPLGTSAEHIPSSSSDVHPSSAQILGGNLVSALHHL